jgi:hypothetical protein
MLKTITKNFWCLSILMFSLSMVQAQTITTPRASQQSTISQQVGLTDITIVYHSPAVKGRKIWGALVPFDRVWRAGANENTLISFSDPVSIEGKNLAAGTYGLYMNPSENSVDIIFSSATKNWGTVAPTPEEIVATVTVSPTSGAHQEWLSYEFIERGGSEVTAALKWEEWVIPFKISVDVAGLVVENIRAELKGLAGFGYLGREMAARYCLANNVALEDAMTWIDQSINAEKRFSNLTVKSGLLSKVGDTARAKAVMEDAMTLATPVQMNIYGYQLLNGGDADGATKVFLKNIKNTAKTHPFYWGFVDSVGEAYLKNKDIDNALKYYKMAREYAPEAQHGYLDGVIKGIMEKHKKS